MMMITITKGVIQGRMEQETEVHQTKEIKKERQHRVKKDA